jgi:hypothetical protein
MGTGRCSKRDRCEYLGFDLALSFEVQDLTRPSRFRRDPNENRWDSAAPKDKKETLPFNNGENSAGIVTIDDEEKPAPTNSAAGKENAPQTQTPSSQTARPAGPGALPLAAKQEESASKVSGGEKSADEARLRFFFSPELKRLIFPEEDSLEEGTDS